MKDRLLHTPEGLRDIQFPMKSKKNELENRLNQVFHSYGYLDVQTPTFEYIDVFDHDKGTIDSKKIFKLFDKDGSILALRPDITPSIARMVAKAQKDIEHPKRLCYIGNTFRNVESYQGKLREFTQAGVELIGIDNEDADAEVIAIMINSLLIAGLQDFRVDVGQAGFFKGLLEEAGLQNDHEEELRMLIDEKNYIALEELLEGFHIDEEQKEAFLSLPRLFGSVEVIDQAKSLTTNQKAINSLNRLVKVYDILNDYGLSDYISFDLGMVSQLNYYTGIVFRGYTYGTGVSIVDGGRYNTLISQFGKDLPSVGFAFIVDEYLLALERQGIEMPIEITDTMLLYNDETRKVAIEISESMRRNGMNIVIGLLDKSIEDNITYGKRQNIGGIMNIIELNQVELINLETLEKNTISVDDLLKEDK